MSVITDDNAKWHCYICNSEPLADLASKCHCIIEKLEQLWSKHQKTDKKQARDSKRQKSKEVKGSKAVVNGKEHPEGSGTMTFSYRKLQIPKEFVKKAKKLVETTAGLNNTFIQFIQQATEEKGDNSIRYRHLKAFKSVLDDLRKAHNALEEALEPEFKSMEMQNGDEGLHIQSKSTDGVDSTGDDHMDSVADEAEEPENDNDELSDEAEMKESQTDANADKVTVQTEDCDGGSVMADEMSLDQDIMSVPPSVPDELFQMVESLADSSLLSQTDNTESDVKSNGNPSDSKRSSPKVKNLIVKLTPVPEVMTRGSRSSWSRNKDKDARVKEECMEEEEDAADDMDGTTGDSPPHNRRPSREKTTPLRKQADKGDRGDSSESNSEEDSQSKAKSSKKTNSVKTEEGKQTKGAKVSSSGIKTTDTDSDEVPDILLQTAAAGHSSEEEDKGGKSVKKCLFKLNKTSPQDKEKRPSKRKLKSNSSDSDIENKGKKTSSAFKKKKQDGSASSNSDSDLEKEIKSLSKRGAGKRRSSRIKKQDEAKEDTKSPRDRKRSYEMKKKSRKNKGASKQQELSSSSEDEEEKEAKGDDSGEDSDQQKIKSIVEENLATASGTFHQSSGMWGYCYQTVVYSGVQLLFVDTGSLMPHLVIYPTRHQNDTS